MSDSDEHSGSDGGSDEGGAAHAEQTDTRESLQKHKLPELKEMCKKRCVCVLR